MHNKKIYFIGIGGISMSGLAELALDLGFEVKGSDPLYNRDIKRLEEQGIEVKSEQVARNIEEFKPDLVVYSAAIPANNPELKYARENNIKNVVRAEFLGWITEQYKHVINIAGTHGKSTTTGICALIMIEAGLDPTVHLGSEFEFFDNNTIRVGKNDYFINEADEYKRSFLKFKSTTSVILNIETDHLDYYKDLDDIYSAFLAFVANLDEDNYLVLNRDLDYYEKLTSLIEENIDKPAQIVTIGKFSPEKATQADFYYKDLRYVHGLAEFDVYRKDEFYTHIKLNIPAEFNVTNSLAAIAAATLNGATPEACTKALSEFRGVSGRFMHIGRFQEADVVADYAHHPNEMKLTLEASQRLDYKNIIPVVEIINYSRARDFHVKYLEILKDCPYVIFYKIFSAREKDNFNESAERFAKEFNEKYENKAFSANSVDELKAILSKITQKDDLILCFGPDSKALDLVK